MPGKHHLRGFKIAKKIGSPLRGSWTMVSIALVDARKTSLMGVQNSKKIGSPLRGSWVKPPPLGKKLDPPLYMSQVTPIQVLYIHLHKPFNRSVELCNNVSLHVVCQNVDGRDYNDTPYTKKKNPISSWILNLKSVTTLLFYLRWIPIGQCNRVVQRLLQHCSL